jgi:general secretion pathway protein I
MKRPSSRHQAFTLLEVMVAIAILGISLTALYSSEAGAIRMASRARKTSLASLLARCKMNEVEEKVAKEGLPAVFANGSDECCEDAEIDGFTCDWEIQPIVLPDTMFGADDEQADGKDAPPAGDDKASITDALSSADPAQMLAGAGGSSMISTMAMQMAFPILKPAFEQQIRRATVTVRWKEGTGEHSFDVTQYLVAEQALAEQGAQNGDGTDAEGNPTGGSEPATAQPPTNPQVKGLGLPGMPGFGR